MDRVFSCINVVVAPPPARSPLPRAVGSGLEGGGGGCVRCVHFVSAAMMRRDSLAWPRLVYSGIVFISVYLLVGSGFTPHSQLSVQSAFALSSSWSRIICTHLLDHWLIYYDAWARGGWVRFCRRRGHAFFWLACLTIGWSIAVHVIEGSGYFGIIFGVFKESVPLSRPQW